MRINRTSKRVGVKKPAALREEGKKKVEIREGGKIEFYSGRSENTAKRRAKWGREILS